MAVQGMKWDQGLSDGEEESTLELESAETISSPGFATSEPLEHGVDS